MSTLSREKRDHLLRALIRLLNMDISDIHEALSASAQLIADAMRADKVDVFLHEPETNQLVAVGTNDSPMARKQKELGLDRLPVSDGGTSALVFLTGQSRLSDHLDRDPVELRGIVEDLGVRSQIGTPLEFQEQRRGSLMVCSAEPEYFSEGDLDFVESVARWVGLIGYRAAAVQAGRGPEDEALHLIIEESLKKLTPRQREVATLIASGLSNMEIAERLVVTPGTVANHVESILRRLGFRSRTQVAALLGQAHHRASSADRRRQRPPSQPSH